MELAAVLGVNRTTITRTLPDFGEDRAFQPAPPVPSMTEAWREAAELAGRFWERATADSRLTPEFTALAAQAGVTVANLRRQVG